MLLPLLAASCGPTPQPFRSATDAPINPLLEFRGRGGVVVAPLGVEGLQVALVEALLKRDIPASVGPGNSESFRVSGEFVADAGQNQIAWRLTRPDGTDAVAAAEPVSGPSFQPAVAQIAATVATVMQNPAPPRRLISREIKPLHVAMPGGLPALPGGILRDELVAALDAAGFALSAAPGPQRLTISGEVASREFADGTVGVAVRWIALSGAGERLGDVRLENRVAQTALTEGWPETARAIARGSVDSLLAIFNRKPTLSLRVDKATSR